MKKLYCTELRCNGWILIKADDFDLAHRRGWETWRTGRLRPGTALCPAVHSGTATATVGEIRKALGGLPAGQTVTLYDPLATGEATRVAALVTASRRARNLDNFPDPPTKKGP